MDEPDLHLDAEFVSVLFDAWESGGDAGEPSSFLRFHAGQIAVYDEDGNDVPVGTFKAIYVDYEGAMNEGLSSSDLFDHTRATFDYFQGLYDVESEEVKRVVTRIAFGDDYVWDPNLLIIDRLTVEPKFRGRQLGLVAMRALILALRPGAGMVAIKPFPLQFERGDAEPADEDFVRLELGSFSQDLRRSTATLRNLYARLGFKPVPKTAYMVRNAQARLPSFDELASDSARRLPSARKRAR